VGGKQPDETSKSGLTWERPPARSRATYQWSQIAIELRANPMAWAKIDDTVRTSIINALRQGSIRVLHPDFGFEVRTTNNVRDSPRTATLFLRWNPDQVAEQFRKGEET